jgi:hypothetical protein
VPNKFEDGEAGSGMATKALFFNAIDLGCDVSLPGMPARYLLPFATSYVHRVLV